MLRQASPASACRSYQTLRVISMASPIRAVLIVVLALLVEACSEGQMTWSEQVRLRTGEVIVVARTATFSENWVAGAGGGSFNKGMSLRIVGPANDDNPGLWEAKFVPIVFDRDPDSGEWFVIATFFHCDSWYELGRPKLPYTEYRFRGGRWIQQSLAQKWIGRHANVLPSDLSDRKAIAESKPDLTVERKEEILSNPAISPEFKRVVDNWPAGSNC